MKSINELTDEFLNSIDRAQSTVKHYRKVLDYWKRSTDFYQKSIEDITAADLVQWIRKLEDNKRAPATIDNYLATIRAFYSYLESKGVENITKNILRKTGQNHNYTRQSLTSEQLFQLLASLKDETLQDLRNAAMIKLMALTGLRCIEVSRADNGDLKFAGDNWYLQLQRKGERAKGSRILISDEVREAIQKYQERKDNTDEYDSPLFVNAGPYKPGGRISPRFLSRIIKKQLISTGLNSRSYCAHSLRHTAACLASTAGSEIEEISAMLGHKTIWQTNTYLRSLGLRSGVEDRAINKITQYWKEYNKNASKTNKHKPQQPL